MAKIDSFTGKLPKRIDDLVIYKLGEDVIIREKSGFSTKELLTAAKYEKCRNNASEFGRVSKACKGIRVALEGILPKKNYMSVVNSLTKRMRSLLVYDTKHARGERLLATSLEHSDALELFKNYCLTPETNLQVRTTAVDGQLHVQDIVFPEGTSWLGFRMHVMQYDWGTFEGKLHSGEWHFEQELTDGLLYSLPQVDSASGNLIFLLEVQQFEEKDGAFVGVGVDEKGVFVVDYLACLPCLPCLPSELHSDAARGCRGDSRMLESTRNDGAGEARVCHDGSKGGKRLHKSFSLLKTTHYNGAEEGGGCEDVYRDPETSRMTEIVWRTRTNHGLAKRKKP